LKHLDNFLQVFCAEDARKQEETDFFGRYHEDDWAYDKIACEKFPVKWMDYFAEYLAEEAKQIKKGCEHLRLSPNSADRYLSAVKVAIGDRCYKINKVSPFEGKIGTRIRDGMMKILVNQCVNARKNLSESRTTSTDEDLQAIVFLCIFSNVEKMAELFFFLISLFHLFGRGGEVAAIPLEDVKLVVPDEFLQEHVNEDYLVTVELWRQKTAHLQKEKQTTHVVVHRTKFSKCFYFAMGYSLVMREQAGAVSEYVFPNFESKLPTDVSEEGAPQSRSKVSALTTSLLKTLLDVGNILNRLDDDDEDNDDEAPASKRTNLSFNPKIGSHGPKRHAVNVANDHPLIKTSWVVITAGWCGKAMHTLFDYLDRNSGPNDRTVARGGSGWLAQGLYSQDQGGRPPTLRAIRRVGEDMYLKVLNFAGRLFYVYTDKGLISPAMRNLLTAVILLRLNQFCAALGTHPDRTFGSITDYDDMASKHRFLELLKAAAVMSGLTFKDLLDLGREIEKNFVLRNFPFFSLDDITQTLGAQTQFQVDTRPLHEQLAAVASVLHQQNHGIVELKHQGLDFNATVQTRTRVYLPRPVWQHPRTA
jgi:hypothetical protein